MAGGGLLRQHNRATQASDTGEMLSVRANIAQSCPPNEKGILYKNKLGFKKTADYFLNLKQVVAPSQ